MADSDVIIIGAGAAGIAAARHLQRQGLHCQVLEAGDRLGGRAWSDGTSLGVPFDRGCAWFHCGGRNPLTTLADAHEITYGGDPWNAYFLDGRFLDAVESRQLRATVAADIQALCNAGLEGRDLPAGELLDGTVPHRAVRDYLISAINGVAASEYASAEAAADDDTGENWIVHQGIGTLMSRLAHGLDVITGCAVRWVDTAGPEVRVGTDQGILTTAAVVVTVSTGVLAAEAIEFRPPLPERKRQAVSALPMGIAEKVALRFVSNPFPYPPNTYLVTHTTGEEHAFGLHLCPAGHPVAVGYAGGPLAAWLNRQTDETAVEFALERLTRAFGDDLRHKVIAHTRTRWAENPLTRGSYSAARPRGGHASRRILAEPVGERLFFAGEATDPTDFATVHGAWQSGIRAAMEVTVQMEEGIDHGGQRRYGGYR